MYDCALILSSAFALDLLIGDPAYRLHPVRCIGTTAHLLEKLLRCINLDGFIGGGLLVILSLAIVCSITLGLHVAIRDLNIWAVYVWHIYLVTSCIALRDLMDHAKSVADALRANDLVRARLAVQHIVGRDAMLLDEAGVARAAVETVAENFVDSVLAPYCWNALGGWLLRNHMPLTGALMALLMYRTVNTLDAMVGYRNERYLKFGRVAAKLDDSMNFVPARVSIPLLCLSAALCGHDVRHAWTTALRDRCKHPSPNAGHPESCLAGALGIRLGGPTVYTHGTVDKPWLGEGDGKVTAEHIDQACRMVNIAGLLSIILMMFCLY